MTLRIVEKQSSDYGENLISMVAILPIGLQEAVRSLVENENGRQLVEIVMDLGRLPEARLADNAVNLSHQPVTHEDIDHVISMLGAFSEDNRAGIERTLHRISAIRNRKGNIIGLTLRVGRAIFGTIDFLRDLIESGKNILFLGRPGLGKTTKLREVARILADDLHKRVIVIDTSNEIGGDGDIPHPAIGGARRMQVPRPDLQHGIMIEAVENHMPEAIIVDEIGTNAEAAAARTIAERGVQLIGTAHGTNLENLVLNPTVSDLVGGVHTVTLSDEEARKRRTPKTINERKSTPTFDIVVEMVSRDDVVVYPDTARAVDTILAGRPPIGDHRSRNKTDKKTAAVETNRTEAVKPETQGLPDTVSRPKSIVKAPRGNRMRIFPYAVSRDLVERVLRDLRLNAKLVSKADQADVVIALRSHEDDSTIQEIAEMQDGPSVYVVKRNSTAQIRRLLEKVFNVLRGVESDEVAEAVEEAENAIQDVINLGVEVALAPRSPAVRKLQHQIISRYHLVSQSSGSEPRRHLIVFPPGKHAAI